MLMRRGRIDSPTDVGRRNQRRLRRALVGSALVGAALAFSSPGLAQATGGDVWSLGGCLACHGNLAEGGNDPAMPLGPNLRRTRLTADQLKEVVSCGRPGSEMPYNLDGAYTVTACYGMPLGPPPANVFPGAGLNVEDIDLLVNFLVSEVVGKTRITRENCALFFGGDANALSCRDY